MIMFAQPDRQKSQDEIVAELTAILLNHFDRSGDETEKTERKIVDFSAHLRAKYPDFKDYTLYHLLVGSTPADSKTHFDFPGEDSVQEFIEHMPEPQNAVERGFFDEESEHLDLREAAHRFVQQDQNTNQHQSI